MFDNICLDHRHAPFNHAYLRNLLRVIDHALQEHASITVVRVDLHLPEYADTGDSITCDPNLNPGLISRFIASLNAKIDARRKSTQKRGKRTYHTDLTYLWCRETGDNQPEWGVRKSHYHLALFVNTDAWHSLGSYGEKGTGLASLIQAAWLSALRMSEYTECRSLIHFPEHPLHYLDSQKADFKQQYDHLTFRLSYFAKERSKSYSREERSFGCSQR
ncbi:MULTISPECIES: inovirus Gp2 family protein [Enterobacteriaceae]|uniref:inovirus Gp2 family protein n=1 Tax=Enterobacteriaceae TaxID=543 RepID=UPI0005E86390|nr:MULTISPECIES: inovirus Gp2 family protein [Enterobacteriaceae]CNK41053.1 Protein of uncharacterised function (DUF3296) [Yersinia frederiksenii]CNL12271.1 Protein of uncharacterised function (DUF3296) [Yersinia frederiksenii]